MATRRVKWIGPAAAVGVAAAAVAVTAQGQDAAPVGTGDVKYYQGKVSPAPPGLLPGTNVNRPTAPPTGGTAGTLPPHYTRSSYPPPPVQPAGGVPPAPSYAKGRPTTPVTAGPHGVRPAAATEPVGTYEPDAIISHYDDLARAIAPMIAAAPAGV